MDFLNKLVIELVEKFVEIILDKFIKIFFFDNGFLVVEIVLKMSFYYNM